MAVSLEMWVQVRNWWIHPGSLMDNPVSPLENSGPSEKPVSKEKVESNRGRSRIPSFGL